MYLGVLGSIAGWGVVFASSLVAGLLVLTAIAFHVRVLVHEEPWAARSFPDAWPPYRAAVPRWVPRLRPWRP
jgi:protein-S-isoprenylcysteine O-methyltransferase Ste14